MRLFIALDFPPGVRERAWRASAPLRDARFPVKWVGEDGLHVTLKFLGQVKRDRVPGLREALDGAAAAVAPFDLRLGGVGGFPSLANPRVVWLGVEAPPALARLQDAVEEATVRLGFEREARGFHPHVTLGRARRGANRRRFAGFEEVAGRVALDEACRVESVELVESVLRPQGARYSVTSSHRLEGEG